MAGTALDANVLYVQPNFKLVCVRFLFFFIFVNLFHYSLFV